MSTSWIRRELEQVKRIEGANDIGPLIDFIPNTTPRWVRPVWLLDYVLALETAPGAGRRLVVAAPPQHGKTECTIHAIVYWLLKYPNKRFIYCTFNEKRRRRVQRLAENVARRAGLAFSRNDNVWTTPEEGSVIWTSIQSGITGEGCDGVFIIDDPYKNRRDAQSETQRQYVYDVFDDCVETRMHPGATIIVMATRWHEQDLSGRLIKLGFEYINIKAIADGRDQPANDHRYPGQPLCEERKTLVELERLRKVNPYSFAAMFQGEPRPREGKPFRDATFYDLGDLPANQGYASGYGVDLAYSIKTSADWSVLIRARKYGNRYFITGMWRQQIEAPEFARTILARQREYAGRAYSYAAGTEKGAIDFIKRKGIRIKRIDPRGRDKLTRAIATSEAWNEGRILFPSRNFRGLTEGTEEWIDIAIDEIENFTGINDEHDDITDALVSLFDGMERGGDDDEDDQYGGYIPQMRTA